METRMIVLLLMMCFVVLTYATTHSGNSHRSGHGRNADIGAEVSLETLRAKNTGDGADGSETETGSHNEDLGTHQAHARISGKHITFNMLLLDDSEPKRRTFRIVSQGGDPNNLMLIEEERVGFVDPARTRGRSGGGDHSHHHHHSHRYRNTDDD